MANVESKKLKKRLNLIEAAQQLFMNDGFANTSIDDIVKRANVAKGTFYLYFHDKFDILRVVAMNISCRVMDEAYVHMLENKRGTLAENVVVIADYIIEYFRKNQMVLKLVEKNFSWPLVREQLSEEQDNKLKRLMDEVCMDAALAGRTREEVFRMFFIVIEMCGSIAFSSIIYSQPDNIDSMKPMLYDAIRKLLS